MKKKLVTIGSAMILVVIVAMSVFASSYTSSLYFQGEYGSEARYYDGQNIYFKATTYVDYTITGGQDWFRVELYRKNWIGTDYIGGEYYKRVGTDDSTFQM